MNEYWVQKRISEIDSSISLVDYLLMYDDEILITVNENGKDDVDKICDLLNKLNEDNKMLRRNNSKLSKDILYLNNMGGE